MKLEQRVENLSKDVQALRLDVAEIKGHMPHLATKAELIEVEGKLSNRITEVESSLSNKIIEVESKLSNKILGLDTKIASASNKVLVTFVSVAIALGAFNWVVDSFYHNRPSSTQVALEKSA